MGKRLLELIGLGKRSTYLDGYWAQRNFRSAIYTSAICVVLELWMLYTLTQTIMAAAAEGNPYDLPWIVSHAIWYVILLVAALIVLVYSVRFVQGKVRGRHCGDILLVTFSIVCLVFGVHFGHHSYVKGEQVLAFTTMTLFVFGSIVFRPVVAFVLSVITFGGFYLYIDHSMPATLGTQVNLFTLWVATFVMALSSYQQTVSEAAKAEGVEHANHLLRRLATYDEQTQIPNMHTFRSAVRVLYEGIDEFDIEYSIVYMDIENFKAYNERYGFAAGDALLRDFANGLVKVFENEMVARLSDDHFVALCESRFVEERVEAARDVLRSLRGEVRLHLRAGAFAPEGEENLDVDMACDRARIACNTTKHLPDRHLRVYDEALDAQVQLKQYVINNIPVAVEEGWIKVYYQPVVRCADGSAELCGYEALARWEDPEYGLLPPYAFIQTLEEFREIDKLDRCIVEQVCADLRAELDAGQIVAPVSLNFSRLDFELYNVPEFLEQEAQAHGIPSELLDIEITESTLTEEFDSLQRILEVLRDDSFSLWLDDFGSGYSSLNVLKDFQFNVLKIDMAFLRGFETNEKARPILCAIISLAKTLGMVTLCEGVETREQFEFLASIGCDCAQGYLFGKPAPEKVPPARLS